MIIKNAFLLMLFLGMTFMAEAQTLGNTDDPQASSTSFILEGKIKGIDDGQWVKLIPAFTNREALDSAQIQNGEFLLSGSLEGPRFVYLIFGKNQGRVNLMLENNHLTLTAEFVPSEQRDALILKSHDLQGSAAHDYYLSETVFTQQLNEDHKNYMTRNKHIIELVSKARGDSDKKMMDSLIKTEAYKILEKEEHAFFQKVGRKSDSLILGNANTWWGPFFMLNQFSYFTPDQQPYFEKFSKNAQESYYGKLLEKELFPPSLVGIEVKDFSLRDKNGDIRTFSDILKGKEYVLIDFWASWCMPCRKEIPNLKSAYKRYASQGFEILSISIDDDSEAWQGALKKENMMWPNLYDNNVTSAFFNIKTIPATFLVDKNGMIIETDLRGEELEKKLSELFK